MHGGSAPQVVAKAKVRLAMAADDAVSALIRIMQDPDVSAADRRQAATAILDRAGISTKAELEVTVAPWTELVAGIVAEVPGIEAPYGDHRDNIVDAEVVNADSPPEPPSRVPYPT
jgi:hypothetical protein